MELLVNSEAIGGADGAPSADELSGAIGAYEVAGDILTLRSSDGFSVEFHRVKATAVSARSWGQIKKGLVLKTRVQ